MRDEIKQASRSPLAHGCYRRCTATEKELQRVEAALSAPSDQLTVCAKAPVFAATSLERGILASNNI